MYRFIDLLSEFTVLTPHLNKMDIYLVECIANEADNQEKQFAKIDRIFGYCIIKQHK